MILPEPVTMSPVEPTSAMMAKEVWWTLCDNTTAHGVSNSAHAKGTCRLLTSITASETPAQANGGCLNYKVKDTPTDVPLVPVCPTFHHVLLYDWLFPRHLQFLHFPIYHTFF